MEKTRQSGTSPIIWPIILSMIVAAGLFLVWRHDRQREIETLRADTETLSRDLGEYLETMGSFARDAAALALERGVESAELTDAIATFHASHSAITQILVVGADLTVETSVGTPFEPFDRLTGEDAVRAVTRARQSGELVFADPFTALPAGPSLQIWAPIDPASRRTEMLGVVISCEGLLREVVADSLAARARIEIHDRAGATLAGLGTVVDTAGPRIGVALHRPEISVRMIVPASGIDALTLLLATAALVLAGLTLWVLVGSRNQARERRRVERALRESEHRYRSLVDNIDVGIALVDREHRVLKANAAMGQLFGLEPDRFVGRQFLEGGSWPDAAGGRPLEVEQESKRSDGSPFTALIKAFPLADEHGVVEGYIELVLDITDRKEAEESRLALERRMRHAQKLESLGVMAGGIAHDFNNLLMGILGNADLALLHSSSGDGIRENLEDIRIAARRAADLCKQMLAFSGKGRYVIEPISLSSLIEEMAHLLQITAVGRIHTHYTLDKRLPLTDADPGQIRQVIMNLVTNAVEAIGDEEGTVHISTGACFCDAESLREPFLDQELPEGRYVYFEITDDGCGMNAQTREKIFDPFFTTKFTGRGLGLAAVLGIVRGHGGALKVTSGEGSGTTIRVLLPESETIAEQEVEVDVREWRGSGTVLLVDDDAMVRTLCQHMLEFLGFDVLIAEGGKAALRQYEQHREQIAVVILDLAMPDLDGESVFVEMRNIDPQVKVLMASGFTEAEVSERYGDIGLAGFLHKPFQIHELALVMRELVEGS